MSQSFNWQPLSPFGARVDLDLSKDIPESVIDELRDIHDRHHILVFSNQRLSHELQTRVSGWFGPVIVDESPEYLATDRNVGGLGNAPLPFHSDLVCSPHPFLGLSLHAIDVTENATSTLFVHAMHAAESLPASLRNRLKNFHAQHLWPVNYSERQRSSTVPEDWPGAVHPVFLPHPRSGEIILCLNATHTDRIVELEAGESERVIQELFGYLYDKSNTYEHIWKTGDFLIWDNLALQHARAPIREGITRTLQRVTIGTHTTMELLPPQLIAAYTA